MSEHQDARGQHADTELLTVEQIFDPHVIPSKNDVRRHFPHTLPQGTQEWRDQWYSRFHDREDKIYELVTSEFIGSLGDYLGQQAITYRPSQHEPTTIVEVAAGSGKLTRALRDYLASRHPGVTRIIASDSGAYGLPAQQHVERLDAQQTIETYKPAIVVVSWMSHQEDWTPIFRAAPSVQEYILIGDPEWTGIQWETHGMDWVRYFQQPRPIPPYEEEGFTRQVLPDISKHQVGRTDSPPSFSSSMTISYKRNPA